MPPIVNRGRALKTCPLCSGVPYRHFDMPPSRRVFENEAHSSEREQEEIFFATLHASVIASFGAVVVKIGMALINIKIMTRPAPVAHRLCRIDFRTDHETKVEPKKSRIVCNFTMRQNKFWHCYRKDRPITNQDHGTVVQFSRGLISFMAPSWWYMPRNAPHRRPRRIDIGTDHEKEVITLASI